MPLAGLRLVLQKHVLFFFPIFMLLLPPRSFIKSRAELDNGVVLSGGVSPPPSLSAARGPPLGGAGLRSDSGGLSFGVV